MRKPSGLNWKTLIRNTWKQCREDHILDQSARLSFYFLLSTCPLLLLLVTILGLLMQSGPALHYALHAFFTTMFPKPAAGLIDETLNEITASSGGFRISFALLFTWLSASQGVLAIIDGLNLAYRVQERRPWWKRYLMASALTIVSLALIISGLLVLMYGSQLSEFLANRFGFGTLVNALWQSTEWFLLLAFTLVAFNTLYVYAPSLRHRHWDSLMPGTVVAVMVWLVVSVGFRVYLHFFSSFTTIYGSIGAVLILLLWFYCFGIAILVGAAVNSEIEKVMNLSDFIIASEVG